ncbi:MAG: carboxypeptidase regulatory-like domain-containing protein [Gemmatimonadota bacterium]|nr:carboxypeptidase regulatory-like domain-containing protein [Gemmatimonadota bacterium]
MYRFDGVEAGAYTVTISNYPDDATFDQTSSAATIATDGENVTVNFPGSWIRTSAIMGAVTVENEGLGGVTVKLSGMSNSETLTDANGQYAFTGLRAGNYTVEISGFDEDDVAFGSTASTAMIVVGESKVVPFEGTYLRTSGVTGQVTVENNPLANVTVSLQGRGEEREATTNGAGQFTFSELRSGDYSVGITNPDPDLYGFDVTSQTVTVAHGETASVPFEGIYLRTASIMGTVTVEGTGLGEVTVTLQGEGEYETSTNAAGQFSFTDLHAGEYSIGISGFDDDEYGFDVTTATVTVALQETATVPFEGILLRTAGIAGTVTVEGHAIPGVTVTVTGGPKDEEHETMTNDAGYYMVDDLHAGDYAVAISDFDANEYEFEATTQSVSVGLRETATVAFQGELLRTAGISGRVSVEGMGLDGIMVTLSGDADMTAETADGGQYAFTGLAEGDYTVAIEGWDEDAYEFEMSSADLAVAQDEAVVQNFEGMHTRTASVSGMLFLDELDGDGMYTDGEPAFAQAGVPLLLQGPGVNDVQVGMTGEDGSYGFENLMAGTYRILVDVSEELVAALTKGGYRFAGELTGQVVSVDAAMAATVNFPFRIVMQTIVAGAVMGIDTVTRHPVGGVDLAMYANAEDADAGMNPLGMATTDSTGMAIFHFPRAMDTGAGGHGTDHLVFVKVDDTGNEDLVVSDDGHIEIEYASTDRISHAPTAAKLLNARANFQWWIKSDADAEDGDMGLEGWHVVIGTDTITTGADGKGSYSTMVPVGAKPAEIMVMADTTQDDTLTMGERWKQPKALKYTHNPLALPATNKAEMNDLGPIYITYTTQTLTLGVYREADDTEGFTDYRSDLPGGDQRPNAAVGKEMMVELMTRDSRNRLRTYEDWDHDCDDDGEKKMPTDPVDAELNVGGGMVSFRCLPADMEFTVRFHPGADRAQMDYGYDEIETFGSDLDFGMTVGAFGDMSGAGPEVRMCSASVIDSTDDWCATFAYQWETGRVYGKVGSEAKHEVTVEPETDGHGALADDDETGSTGAYSIDGLQDGVYTATAESGNSDFQILGDAEVMGIALYHDEACWANPDPDNDACSSGELMVDEIDENDDTTWAYQNEHMQNWSTGRLNLAIRGYVANDGQDGEDMDGLLRGDESKAGVTVKLLKGTKSVATTETDADGYYEFDGLEAGSYTVSASSGSNYRAIHAINRHPKTRAWRYVTSKTATAEEYTLNPDEADLAKPFWNRAIATTGRTMGNGTVTYTEGEGTAARSDKYYNFALVYTDGEFTGKVNNLSGSDGSIDVVLEVPSPLDTDRKTDTNTRGNFAFPGLIEAIGYTATIEDVGFAAPCLDAGGDPDDDGPTTDDGTGTQVCTMAATELTGDIEGENDHEGLGTLHVYSTAASADDSLANGVRVRFRQQGTTTDGTYNDTTSAAAVADDARQADSEETENTTSLGTISWQSAGVTFWFGTTATATNPFIPDDATVKLMVGTKACSGYTCNLVANKTGSTDIGTPMENTITVTVTAENGYDDHEYSLVLARADPIGNALAATNIQLDSAGTAGRAAADAGTDAFTFTTYDEATSANLIFGLTVLGVVDDNAYCAQRVSVKATGGNAIQPMEDDDDDVCPSTRYNLAASASPGTSYDVTVTSEDGVDKVYILRVIVGPEDS